MNNSSIYFAKCKKFNLIKELKSFSSNEGYPVLFEKVNN